MTFNMNDVLNSSTTSVNDDQAIAALMGGSDINRSLKDGERFECPVDKLVLYHNADFKEKTGRDQPYDVLPQKKLEQLRLSIKENGLIEDLTVRTDPDDPEKYEILAGRNRFLAITSGNLMDKIPCVYKECVTEDDARKILIETNEARRESISELERAFAIAFRFESIKMANKDRSLGRASDELVGEEFGIAPTAVHNYVQITNLVPGFQEMLKDELLATITASHIGTMSKELQRNFYEAIDEKKKLPDKVVKKVLEASKDAVGNLLSVIQIEEILLGPPAESQPKKFKIPSEYRELVPKHEEMEDFFIDNYIKNALLFYSEFLQEKNKAKNPEEPVIQGQMEFE